MKNIKFVLAFFACAVIMASCAKTENSAEASKTTFLPLLKMNGSNYIDLTCTDVGYEDEGLVATVGGEAINVDVTTSSRYFGRTEINSPDVYQITYSAVNVDGIPGADVRTVVLPPCNGDLENSIAGTYSAEILRESGEAQSASIVMIVETGPNEYLLSDGLSGFYDQGRGFGSDYAAKGATVTFDGTAYTVGQSVFPIWGNTIDVTDFVVDAASKTITYHGLGNFGNGNFDIVLTQK